MSGSLPESGNVTENPEPEADAELSGVEEAAESDGDGNLTDKPEDECGTEEECETDQITRGRGGQVGGVNLLSETEQQDLTCRSGDTVSADTLNENTNQREQSDMIEDEEPEGLVSSGSNVSSEPASPVKGNSEQCGCREDFSASDNDDQESVAISCGTTENVESVESNAQEHIISPGQSLLNATGDVALNKFPDSQDEQKSELAVSAAPEDESLPDCQPTVQNGQAPECDQTLVDSTSVQVSCDDSVQVVTSTDTNECNKELGLEVVCPNKDFANAHSDHEENSQNEIPSHSAGNIHERDEKVSDSFQFHSDSSIGSPACSENAVLTAHSSAATSVASDVSQTSSKSEHFEDDLLSELDAALDSTPEANFEKCIEATEDVVLDHELRNGNSLDILPNGLAVGDLSKSPELQAIQEQLLRMHKQVEESQTKLSKLQTEKQQQAEALAVTVKERDTYLAKVNSFKSRNPDDLYLPQIKELEYTISQQQNDIRGLKDKLSSHDAAAKRAVSTLQNELKVRVDQVTRMYEECVKEKDSMVIKYAESEQKNIECSKKVERIEGRLQESARDRESMVCKVKAVKAERHKAVAEMEAKSSELGQVVKEVEKLREALSSADVRIKWAQNKLKAELEAHKETKGSLEKTNIKLKEAREETQQIRRDCQAMIKTYQESEEIKSNSLDKELKVKESELIIQRQERSDREEMYQMTSRELDSLRIKHKAMLDEITCLKEKLKSHNEDHRLTEETMKRYEDVIQKQKEENRDLHARTEAMSQLQDDFDRAQRLIKSLDREMSDLKVNNKDLQLDMEGCRKRESELLELTEKLSRKNAKLQSDNTNLNNQVVTLSSESEKWKMEIQELDTRVQDLEEQVEDQKKRLKEESESLRAELDEKSKHVENYRQQLEDEKDLTRTLKRKHVNNIKDLTRQLNQSRKKLETYENHTERDTTSMGSRTSSNGSLNTAAENQVAHNNVNSNHNSVNNSRAPSQEPVIEHPVITEQVEVDKQVLIERIVKLQKAHARKNEKLEFLDDHIHQLVDEIQRKNRIIQHYVMREESGTLAPEYMDENKLRVRTEAQALLAKKGGIMASVYSQHQQDGTMTLDLSLEINKKLQSVLEDTLLKNITLKESLDTLGTEIARLSQENRNLQLTIQQLPH